MLLGRNELNMLDSLNEREYAVITALLRCYGGLFSDFCYIDESLVAQQAGLTVPETYMILKDMTARRILHFIPRKKNSTHNIHSAARRNGASGAEQGYIRQP